MAVVWTQFNGVDRYEVRRAGQCLRLYTNGVFHTQYHPGQPVTGSVWDLLLLPALAQRRAPERILVLGVGGGAVIRQLNHFLSPALIVGIELNAVHLTVARRWFSVSAPNVCLLQADAQDWLDAYRGPPFDYIVDDLFGHRDGNAMRAIAPGEKWCRRLRRVLAPSGTLVINCESETQLRRSALWHTAEQKRHWCEAQVLTTPLYENAVGAFFTAAPNGKQFAQRLEQHWELDQRRAGCRLRYQCRPLRC